MVQKPVRPADMIVAAKPDRASGIAVWRQIADMLRTEMAVGAFSKSDTLPTEKELSEAFSVNRHTVRLALKALVSEQLVERRQGGGTRILRKPRILYPIAKRTRLHQGVGSQAGETRISVLDVETTIGSPDVCAALDMPENTFLMRVETLSMADSNPLAVSTNWFEARRFSEIGGHIVETGSITLALGLCGVADYVRVSTIVEAVQADSTDAACLQVAPGALILRTITINATTDGMPFHFAKTRFLAERVALQFNTPPDHAGG